MYDQVWELLEAQLRGPRGRRFVFSPLPCTGYHISLFFKKEIAEKCINGKECHKRRKRMATGGAKRAERQRQYAPPPRTPVALRILALMAPHDHP